jgi:hypothetical protein
VYCCGLVQAAKVAPSRLHWKVLLASSALKVNSAAALADGLAGYVLIYRLRRVCVRRDDGDGPDIRGFVPIHVLHVINGAHPLGVNTIGQASYCKRANAAKNIAIVV